MIRSRLGCVERLGRHVTVHQIRAFPAVPTRGRFLSTRRPSNRILRSLCGEVGPGDGDDPRLARKDTHPSRAGRKARQLCAQVAESLGLALAATADDETLASLIVIAADPAPDTSRLLVTVALPKGDRVDPGELLRRLDRATPRLRTEVARSITRRRAPALSFRLSLVE